MGTFHFPVDTQVSVAMSDGGTNTHIMKQIQRLRLSRGWTKHDLEQAAGMAPDSLEDFDAGIRSINVDTLRKIIAALESDITEVWPPAERVDEVQSILPPVQAFDPLYFSRLAEMHSLTGAEASCMFMGDDLTDYARTPGEETVKSSLQTLSAINLKPEDRDWLRIKVLQRTATSPWFTFVHCEKGRSLYLCLRNPRLQFGAEILIKGCLSAWLASTPL